MLDQTTVLSTLKRKQGDGTQEQLAARIGISPAYLCDVLKGNRKPKGKVLEFLGLEELTMYRENKRRRSA
jgi:transcriptional regulator with XRE-family HTH domain